MFYTAPMIVLAAIGDILGFLVTAALVVIWLIGQISGIKQQAQRPAQPKPAPRPPRPAKPIGQPQRGGPGRPAMPDPIADEIEEFLRRAVRRRKQGQMEEVEVLVPEPVAKQRRPQETVVIRPTVAGAQPEPEKVRTLVPKSRPEPIQPESDLDTGLAQHVTQFAGASSFQERTSGLGKDVAFADNRFESHRHQTFDHTVSHLAHRESEPDKTPSQQASPLVQTIVNMVQSPESMQQVVVWQEIFRRPEDRW